MPTSHLSYSAEYDAFDLAEDSDKGIRIPMSNRSAAWNYRNRLHYARCIDRKKNCETYKEGDPLFGSSVYDKFVVKVKQDTADGWWVYIEKNDFNPSNVEAL